jgi:hypothetical protein
MADLLTNIVGALLFILVFTVLTASGAVMRKQLPLERPTMAKPTTFLCFNGRTAALDLNAILEEFIKPLEKKITSSNLSGWVKQFSERRIETDTVVVTGSATNLVFAVHAVIEIRPRPGVGGETSAALKSPSSAFRRQLAGLKPGEVFADFLVYPDGLTSFRTAREVASQQGFGTGWTLYGTDEVMRFCVAGCASSGDGGSRIQN